MSARDTSGSAPQHNHLHNNTMSRNQNFWVDQVTPPPPRGNDNGWGTTKGCNGSGCNVRIRLQPRLLPTAFTAYCPLFEPMSTERQRGGGMI